MPKDIFNFIVRYINYTLATRKNLAKWGISSTSECYFCLLPEILLHIVAGCKSYLDQGCYTWRHDSVLIHIAKSFKALQDIELFSDLPGYLSPSITSGDNLRPDFLLISPSNCLFILELTVGYEANLASYSIRKEEKYCQLNLASKPQYRKIKPVNLSMGAPGAMSKSSTFFLEMMKEIGEHYHPINFLCLLL